MTYLCIDFGGTKTLVCTLDENGTVIDEIRFETPADYPDFIETLTNTIQSLPDTYTRGAMSVPGLIEHETGRVIGLGNRPWTDFSLKDDIRQRAGIELTLLNDARLAGLAEAVHLKEQFKRVLYITVSTGIGGALAVNGELVEALHDTEFGKMPLMIDGSFTPWEEVASGRAIANIYGRASEIEDPEIWRDIANRLALGVGPACTAFQPDAIVFGGGAGQHTEKFAAFLQEKLKEILHPVVRQPQALLTSHYKDRAVIYGCFILARK